MKERERESEWRIEDEPAEFLGGFDNPPPQGFDLWLWPLALVLAFVELVALSSPPISPRWGARPRREAPRPPTFAKLGGPECHGKQIREMGIVALNVPLSMIA